MNTCICPICFIIPNDIARQIAKNATDEFDRDLALRHISRNSRLRERRTLFATDEIKPIETAKNNGERLIYTAKYKSDLPGYFVRGEGDRKTADQSVSNSYTALGIIRDFLTKILARNSYDAKGGDLISTVHYERNYNNAFWDGTQMVYGDGDGKYFNSFTSDLEITAHELFHGVIGATAKLRYYGESGALNESWCDVFGCMIKQWKLKQTVKDADWIIGKGLFTSRVKGVGVRKLDEPGKAFNDPVLGKDDTRGHYTKRYKGTGDYAGVHLNSGIPSLAFVTACKTLGGKSWEKMGQVWYETLITKLKVNSNFKNAALATIQVAKDLFEDEPEVAQAIQSGWEKVGVI